MYRWEDCGTTTRNSAQIWSLLVGYYHAYGQYCQQQGPTYRLDGWHLCARCQQGTLLLILPLLLHWHNSPLNALDVLWTNVWKIYLAMMWHLTQLYEYLNDPALIITYLRNIFWSELWIVKTIIGIGMLYFTTAVFFCNHPVLLT